jgi:ankyrin repeat protein
MARLLLTKGAYVDATKNRKGNSALRFAVSKGNVEMVKLLLEKGANVNGETVDGTSPLLLAIHYGHVEVVKVLLAYRARYGRSVLRWAALSGHVEILKLFLEKGAIVDGKDPWLLNIVVRKGDVEMVRLMLDMDKGSSVDTQVEGEPLLHLAAKEGDVKMVRLLLDKGANIEAQDGYGLTALCKAVNLQYLEVIKLLLDRGASRQNSDGTSLLDFAREVLRYCFREEAKRMEEVIDILEHHQ